MGEAKRRGSKAPSQRERARRLANRYWTLYPRPLRTLLKFDAEVHLWMLGIAVLILFAALVVGLWRH